MSFYKNEKKENLKVMVKTFYSKNLGKPVNCSKLPVDMERAFYCYNRVLIGHGQPGLGSCISWYFGL